MHILHAFGIADNSGTEWLHSVILNIVEVFLKDSPVLPPHSLSEIEPNLLLRVDVLFQSQICIPVVSKSIFFCPIPEVICRYPFQLAKGPLVSCEILCLLLAFQQSRPVFLKRVPSQYVMRVGNPLIHIHRIGDLKVLKHSNS